MVLIRIAFVFLLVLNVRITNGRSGLEVEVWSHDGEDVAEPKFPIRINGPLGRLSETRLERDVLMERVNTADLGAGKCQVLNPPKVLTLNLNGSSFPSLDGSSRSRQMTRPMHVKCNDVVNLSISLGQIHNSLIPYIISFDISWSNLPFLNLSAFHHFPNLEIISVTFSNVSKVFGILPLGLRHLNLSHNNLKSIEGIRLIPGKDLRELSTPQMAEMPHREYPPKEDGAWTFPPGNGRPKEPDADMDAEIGENGVDLGESESESGNTNNVSDDEDLKDTNTNDFRTLSQLEVIDLSHNKITQLPKSIFYLRNLQSLRLAGNQLRCQFVWQTLWQWLKILPNPYNDTDTNVLSDSHETYCGVGQNVTLFKYSVFGVLQARKDVEEACGRVNKTICRSCGLYAFQRDGHPPHPQDIHPQTSTISHPDGVDYHKNKNVEEAEKSNGGAISISLKLDCSSRKLTELPQIPPQTWELNISNNFIKDLSPLKLPMYSNLLMLDGNNNQVNLDSLEGTPFIDKYNYLNLKNNGFAMIPTYFLTSLKTARGQGVTFLGRNQIDCDCNSVKDMKPLLLENQKKIRDMKDIFCKSESNAEKSSIKRVKDIKYSDVCHLESSNDNWDNELYIYGIIGGEAVLILLIIGKVWHDQRTFRRTGVLPWCSAKMPRLPCDTILESLKEPPNATSNIRHSGSAASSNINVQNPSVSQIPMVGLRPSGSGGGSIISTSSPSNSLQIQPQPQPHFSATLSSSSRTSSV